MNRFSEELIDSFEFERDNELRQADDFSEIELLLQTILQLREKVCAVSSGVSQMDEHYRQQLSHAEEALEASRVKERAALTNASNSKPLGPDPETAALLKQEIERIEASLAELNQVIASMLQEPIVELGKIARKNIEMGELNAYLKGLKFTASLLGM